VLFEPGTCSFSAMKNSSAATFTCMYINGHAVVPVQAAFGGWGMYRASLFRRTRAQEEGCRHDLTSPGCEHISLSNCLMNRFGARQVIATGLVINWEGCSEKQQRRWDGWYPGKGPVET
jgi:hypothetical protein